MKATPTKSTPAKQATTTSFLDQQKSEANFFGENKAEAEPFFPLQTKLSIGSPNDQFEQEADATADRVVRESNNPKKNPDNFKAPSPTPLSIQHKCAECEAKEQEQGGVDQPKIQRKPIFESDADPNNIQRKCASCGKEETVQKKSDGSGVAGQSIQNQLNNAKGGGSNLPEDTRHSMESSIGADFSEVKVHTDSNAIQMNKDLGSQAFTHGSDVFFNEGKYDTNSDSGKHLLAHELTHTVQQGGKPKSIQRKPSDHQHKEDGEGVKKRMHRKAKEEAGDDADFSKSPGQMTEEEREKARDIDPSKKSKQKSDINAEGTAKPDVNRPAEEKPKVEDAAEDGKETMEEDPQAEEKEKKEKEVPRADLKGSDAKEKSALAALAKAEQIKMPEEPPELPAPRIEKPKDSKGEELPSNPDSDKNVRALHEIAKLFVENAYDLKKQSAGDAQQGAKMRAKLDQSWAKTKRVTAGSAVMKEDLTAREEINTQEEEALVKVEEDTAMVKAEAPKLMDKAGEGKEESSSMVSETQEQQKDMEAKKPDDADAAKDAEKQSKDTKETADGAQKTDDAFAGTSERAEKYQQDAIEGEAKNLETRTKVEENKQTAQQTGQEIERIDAHNAQSEAELGALDHYPQQVEQETLQRAQSGEQLYQAAVVMNDQLVDIQEEFLNNMAGLKGKEEAQKELDEKQAQENPPEEETLSPEEEMVYNLQNMEEAERDEFLASMDESELESLNKTLDTMPTQEEKAEEEGIVGKADENTGRKSVDLMKAFGSGESEQGPPDPRQEQINEHENTRATRLGEVKQIADTNFTFLSKEQKQMLAQKLAMQSAVSGLFNIDILEMGKGMIMGMINPVESLKGVIDGASKIAGGFVNLFNAEAWAKDPLGNLLQSAADIATGLTMVLMSITGLATAITIIMVAITIASFGFAAPVTGPIISFMASVISTVGGWTVVTGLIALALNALTYIKNVHDAGVAENTDQLLAESDQIKQNMTDGFTSAMAVVGGKGDKAGAQAMKGKIRAAGGAKNFAKEIPGNFKGGLKSAATKAGGVLKAGAKTAKRVTSAGAKKVKNGIRKALQKTKSGLQDLGGGMKKKFADLKKKFRNNKADGGLVDTPHGKMKTPKPGESLGSFNGKKVKAEMEFPDGHRAKTLENGKCAICSNCEVINKKFAKELEADPRLSSELKEIETRLARQGDAPDPALIARQKKIHDKLLGRKTQRVKMDYDAANPSGGFDRTRIKKELGEGKEFNPDTGRFGSDGVKKTARLDDAAKAELVPATKGKNSTPKKGTPEHTQLKAQKQKIETEIKKVEAEIDSRSKRAKDTSNTDPDAVEYRQKKNESFEKRHPEAEHKTQFEKEYDEITGGDVNDPKYLKERQEAFQNDRKIKREQHSEQYDRGKKNEAKGEVSETVRGEADGMNRRKISHQEEVTLPNGEKVKVAPDFDTPTGFGELKSGKLSLTPEVEDQILRYAALAQKTGKKVTYELLGGASENVLNLLNKYGIDYIDYTKII